MTPAVTLLVPCFNAARFLPRLHAAVAALTVPFARVLCYDDGSTDDTVSVALTLGLEILTGNPNRGVAHARNQLVAAARTEWIHFHDADDLIAPTYLERLAPACDDRHDVVSCDADWIGETRCELIIAWRYDPAALADAPFHHLLAHAMGLNSSIIRRAAWDRIGGCDETLTMWEDADVHIRLAHDGARFHHEPEVLTWSLRRSESFSHDYLKSWRCRLTALERYAALPSDPSSTALLAVEAEKTATELFGLNDVSASRRALALCVRLGGDPPTTTYPVIRLLKLFLPAYLLFSWQCLRRQRAARRPA